MNTKIITLPGDGIGPEVTREGVRVLEYIAKKFGHQFEFEEHLIGGCAIDATGEPLSNATLDACRAADAVLLGAVGGPQWDDPRAKTRPEVGLLGLRKGLGLFANLRPVKPHPALAHASPLKPEKIAGVDFIVIRELTGGLYFGKPQGRFEESGKTRAVDTMEYSDAEITRIVQLAFRLAEPRRAKVTSVDKANVLASSRLWREIATEIGRAHPQIKLDHLLVDTCAMKLIASPAAFDVIVTENMFGDILTDEAAVLVGSMGLLPSASLGAPFDSAQGVLGVYEPIHGSAPDIAGKSIANPIGTILSAAMLLRYSLNLSREADAIERAVDRAIDEGCRTADIAQPGERVMSTREMADAIIERM
ncbi:MAG: 3-isopropylmalate dehydrogenase [Chloroflexi bacterium]|nr:3-isopropylmalate dehydrogenase [Chloroflexota bacterium]